MTGRPTKYKKEFDEQVEKLCLLGATNEEIARFFNVRVTTIDNWIARHPSFLGAIKNGKEVADANVASRLYQRAMGYCHPDEKVFNDNGREMVVHTVKHYPPDTAAAIFWLNNRTRKRDAPWSNKQEHVHDFEMDSGVIVLPVNGQTAEDWSHSAQEHYQKSQQK